MTAPTYLEWLSWAGEFGLIGLMVPACGLLAAWLCRDALVQQGLLRGVFVLVLFLSLGEAVGVFRGLGGGAPHGEPFATESWRVSYSSGGSPVRQIPEAMILPADAAEAEATMNLARHGSWLESRSWLPGLLLLSGFCGGLVYLLALLMGLHFYVRRHRAPVSGCWRDRFEQVKRRMGYQGSCRLWRSSGRLGPFVMGYVRPIVLLPERQMEAFSTEEWELVLAHELAHLKNRDGLWLPLVNLITLLFWWHPMLWLAKHRLQQVGEFAADSRAIAASFDRKCMAACLVKFGRMLKLSGGTGGVLTRGLTFQSELARRVRRLIEGRDSTLHLAKRDRCLRVCLCAVFTLSLYFGVFRALSPNVSAGVPIVDRMVAGLGKEGKRPTENPAEALAKFPAIEDDEAELVAGTQAPETLVESTPEAVPVVTETRIAERDAKPSEDPPQRLTRRYRIEPANADRLIRQGSGEAVNRAITEGASTRDLILAFLEDMGVRFAGREQSGDPDGAGASFFLDEQRGQLLVRATEAELAKIEEAVTFLVSTPEQVMIDVKIVEVEGDIPELFNQRAVQRGTAESEAGTAGAPLIFDEEAFGELIETLETSRGVSVLSAPRVTTLSGRRAEISAMQSQSVVFPASYEPADGQEVIVEPLPEGREGNLTEGEGYLVQDVRVGPLVRVLPSVRVSEQLIDLDVSFVVREFLGYDDPGPVAVNGELLMAGGKPGTLPLPRFRDRAAKASVLLQDGQTVMLRGMTTTDITKMKSKVPLLGDLPLIGPLFRREQLGEKDVHLVVFVTPLVIDPAGNRRFNP